MFTLYQRTILPLSTTVNGCLTIVNKQDIAIAVPKYKKYLPSCEHPIIPNYRKNTKNIKIIRIE